MTLDVVIVGNSGGTNVAQSLMRGAEAEHLKAELVPVQQCHSSLSLLNSLSWRLLDRRPPHDDRLMNQLRRILEGAPPKHLITTGIAPVYADTLQAYRSRGVVNVHFSTDDPWNRSQRAHWHLRALQEYDVVFTPRRNNVDDLRRLPCREVRYLPFAYDPTLFGPGGETKAGTDAPDVLFVGGADKDRADFFEAYFAGGGCAGLVGGYWERFRLLKPHALGHRSPSDIAALTRSAKVNLILVRRANRDGHVMRSFEAAALGGCLLVENTPEHREIFGADRDCVQYFSSAAQAASRAQTLVSDPTERRRLSSAVQQRILNGANTYADRLKSMLTEARAVSQLRGQATP